jgi:hypothetical protein
MKNLMPAVFVATTILAGATAVQAMSVAPLQQDSNPQIIQVYGGGYGWHRGPYGGCRPLYNCPPGWHTGPYGRRCFPN